MVKNMDCGKGSTPNPRGLNMKVLLNMERKPVYLIFSMTRRPKQQLQQENLTLKTIQFTLFFTTKKVIK